MGASNSNQKDSYVLSYTNGDKYEGDVVAGVREGKGTYYYHNGDKYEGFWKSNKKHGMGTMYYKDGNLYVGQWRNSEKEGIGTLYYRNGEKYYGNFKIGKKHGKGFLISPEGNKYIGYFSDNKKDGKGIIYFNKNKTAREEWKEGVLVSSVLIATLSESQEVNDLLSAKELDISFDNYIEDQLNFHQIAGSDKFKSKFFTLEVAKYFKARIPNNYFDAMQIVLMCSDLIYENPHVPEWGTEEICQWLRRLGLDDLQSEFQKNCVNGINFLKLNAADMKLKLNISKTKDIKLILKSIDFLRIFVKLKIDYQEYIEYEKVREIENLNNPITHHMNSNRANALKEKENANINYKSLITGTTYHFTGSLQDRKHSDILEAQSLSYREETKVDDLVIENQEFVLTKMAISINTF
jgi:hypothetical protein